MTSDARGNALKRHYAFSCRLRFWKHITVARDRLPPPPLHASMIPTVLRARSAGEILDMAFQIYRTRWTAMATATAVLVLPLILVEAVAPLEILGFVDLLGNLFFLAASAAVVVIASGAYMGTEVDGITAVKKVGSRFGSVWGAAIIQGVVVGIGFLLLIVPGIIFIAWTFAMQQAVMIEGQSAGEAFDRSRELARGHLKHILLTSVLATLIVLVGAMGLGVMVEMALSGERMVLIVMNLAMIAINPIAAVVGTVLYYDLRIRKEAFDVKILADRLAEQPAPVSAV